MDLRILKLQNDAWIYFEEKIKNIIDEINIWFDPEAQTDVLSEGDVDTDGYNYPDNWNLFKIEGRINFDFREFNYQDWREFNEEMNEDILDDDIYLHNQLRHCLELLKEKLLSKSKLDLRSMIDDLTSICEELNIKVLTDLNELQPLLDILEIKESQLIYIPKRKILLRPTTILLINEELIKLIAKYPEILYKISPRQFEEIIAELFFKQGFEVELTKATRDGGRDIIAIHEKMDIKTKYIIECKRYQKTKKVTLGLVQRLYGVKIAEAANKAILATTSTFTRDAKAFAHNHIWDLALKDYNDIMFWIKKYR